MSEIHEEHDGGGALAIIGGALVPTEVFRPGGVDAVLARIEAEVRATKRDMTTEKGRAAIRSLALKVSKSKTALDGMGKGLTEEWARRKAAVDGDRRMARERLDALRDEVLAPVEQWEARNQARIDAHKAALLDIRRAPGGASRATSIEIAARLVELRDPPPRDWGEFEMAAADAYSEQIAFLEGLLVERKAEEEAEAAEAARVAAEAEAARKAAEDARLAREAEIAAAAAEAARIAAETKAAAEAAEVARVAEAARVAAEEAAAEQARQAAAREAALAAQAEKARNDAADALRREQAASEKAARDAAAAAEAAEAERKRIADAAEAERREADARAADRAHRGKINSEIKGAILELGISEEQAVTLTRAMVVGTIPHIFVRY